MLATALLLCILGLSGTGCSGGRIGRTAPPADSSLSPAAHREDVDVLTETVLNIHPAFTNSAARANSLRRAAQTLTALIDRPLTRCDFYRRLAPLVTALDDGHTFVGLPGSCFEAFMEAGPVFPFDVAFADSTATVLCSYGDEKRISPGTQIVAIDGTPVYTLRNRFVELLPGGRTAFRRWRLEGETDTFKFFLWLVYGVEAPFNVTYLDGGRLRHAEIAGLPADTIRARREAFAEPSVPYEYRALGDRTGLLDIRSFGAPEDDFEDFLASTFARLRRTGTDHLIIDVRDNGGGNAARAGELLRYLASSPFALNDTVAIRASERFKTGMKRERIPAALRWLPLQYLDRRGRAVWGAPEGTMVSIPGERISPHEPDERFEGRVSVLVNEGTFSAATQFASGVKELDIGTLVGRETGGPAGVMFAQPIPARLPNSGLWIRVSTMRFQFGEKPPDWPARGVVPDHRVSRDLQARIRGADPTLEAVLTH